MKKRWISLLLVLAVFVGNMGPNALAAGGADEAVMNGTGTKTVTVNTKMSNDISVTLPSVNLSAEFSGATTNYSEQLALLSSVISATRNYRKISCCKNVLTALGFSGFRSYDVASSGLPDYATAFYTASQSISRGGERTKLYIVSILDTNRTGMEFNVDYLNKECSTTVDYSASAVKMYADEADRIYGIITKDLIDAASDENYVVWVTGYGHGGSVANCLSKKLIDKLGTARVAAYLFGVGNTHKSAKTEQSSKYYSIFNINLLDDIGCYLPLSKWGYGRWGVDVELGLPADSKALESELNGLYHELTANMDRDDKVRLNSDYAFFSSSERNGKKIGEFIGTMESLLPSISSYYTKQLSTKKYNDGWDVLTQSAHTVNMIAYDFLSETLDFLAQDSYSSNDIKKYIYWVGASFRHSCDVQPIVKFICKYGFGITSVSNALSEAISNLQLTMQELVINHLSETYMAWMLLDDPGDGILNYGSLPCETSARLSSVSSNGVSAAAEDGFYQDQCFTATANETRNEYTLSLCYDDTDEACESYTGTALLTIPADDPDSTEAVFQSGGQIVSLSGSYDASKHTLSYRVPSLNGTLTVTDPSDTVEPDIFHMDYSDGDLRNQVTGEAGQTIGKIISGTGLAGAKAYYQTASSKGVKYTLTESDKRKTQDSFTMEAYFYLSDVGVEADQDIFSSLQNSGFGIELERSHKLSAYARFRTKGSTDSGKYVTISRAVTGQIGWTHAVICYDGLTLSFYLNGQLVGSEDVSDRELVSPSQSAIFVAADTDESNKPQGCLKSGSMVNRANLYSEALSPAQIAVLYQNLPVAADVISVDYSLGSIQDLNGCALTKTTPTVTADSGLAGAEALRIDGVDSVLGYTVSNFTRLEHAFTMETYFYLSTTMLSRSVDVFSDQEAAGLGIEINAGGKLTAYSMFGEKNSGYTTITEQLPERPGWVHAVITFDGETMAFYCNGALVDTQTATADRLAIPETDQFFVGTDTNKDNGPAESYILPAGSMVNCARLYSRALTAEQVRASYANMPSAVTVEGSTAADTVTFGVVSDVHITQKASFEKANYEKALEYFSESGAVSTFVAGDLTNNGTPEEYAAYVSTLNDAAKGSMTVHESAGNHDARGDRNDFESYTDDSLNEHYVINGYHFIKLSPDNDQTKAPYDSSVTWLERELKLAAEDTGDRPIFVFAHHPIKDTVYVSDEWYGYLSKELFDDYPQVVFFAGHSHAPNNHPASIWQGNFTAVNTATLSYYGFESGYGTPVESIYPDDGKGAQGLLVKAAGSEVTITTCDFSGDTPVEVQQWVFDTSLQVTDEPETFPYDHESRAAASKAPYFAESAELTIEELAPGELTVSFPQALIAADDTGDIVHSYHFVIYNRDGGIVKDVRDWSGFYLQPMPAVLTRTLEGITVNDAYYMELSPVNAYGVEGAPLTLAFESCASLTHAADIIDINFAGGEAGDRNGHSLTVYDAPVIETDDALGRSAAGYDGSNDGHRYALTAGDYEHMRNGFTMELYVKPDYSKGSNVILGNMDSAGFGFQYMKSEEKIESLIYIDGQGYAKLYADAEENVWVHLMLSYDGTTMKLYKNGVLADSRIIVGAMRVPQDSAKYLVLGGDISAKSYLQDLTASKIALFRIYSDCLGESEIATRYSLALLPQADILDIDFNSTDMGADGNGHTRKTNGAPGHTYSESIERGYAVFDGNDDGYRYALSKADYDRMQNGFSVEVYVRPDYASNGYVVLGNMDSAGFGFQYLKQKEQIETWVHIAGRGYVNLYASVPDGVWAHLVLTYDGTTMTLYKDGTEADSMTVSGQLSVPQDSAKYLYLGGDVTASGGFQDITASAISLFRMYGSCLTAEETEEIYAAVSEKITLAQLLVTEKPDKTEYLAGELFDSDGMVVTAQYNNGVRKEVEAVLAPDRNLIVTDTAVTLSYTEGGVTKTAEVEIQVRPGAEIVSSGGQYAVNVYAETEKIYVLTAYYDEDGRFTGSEQTEFLMKDGRQQLLTLEEGTYRVFILDDGYRPLSAPFEQNGA